MTIKSHVNYTATSSRGSCSTANWDRSLEWTAGVTRAFASGGKQKRAIERLLQRHAARLPNELSAGQQIVTELDDDDFPDTVYLMTECNTAPEWAPRKRGSKLRLFSLIGFPSSF